MVGVARRVENIQVLSKKLSSAKGKLYAQKADLTKEEDIQRVFEWTSKNLGPVHILVNNAGTMVGGSLANGKSQDWKLVLNLNVLGLCIATREAVKIMKANNVNGHIVHINSTLGHTVANIPDLNVYPASKYAVTALTETLRQELTREKSKIKISVSILKFRSPSTFQIVSSLIWRFNVKFKHERVVRLPKSLAKFLGEDAK